MLSTLTAKEPTFSAKDSDPHDIFVIDPEVVLPTRADDLSPKPAQGGADLPLEPHAAASPAASAPSVDASFRATAGDHVQVARRSPIAKWAKRAFMAFLFALCSALAAAAWKHHGDRAEQMAYRANQIVASWVPQLSRIASPAQDNTGLAEQAESPAAQASAVDPAAAAQPAAQVQASDGAPQTIAVAAPDSAQLLQSMARDIATMGQQIEQLKASIDQLKAGQEQMAREMKTTEARPVVAQPRISAAPPRPPSAPVVRRPRAGTYYPAQAAAAAPTVPPPQPAPPPVQLAPESQNDGPVVRPPMPVR